MEIKIYINSNKFRPLNIIINNKFNYTFITR